MKNFFTFLSFLFALTLNAQENVEKCKVLSKDLDAEYTGECKKGFADGKGEAKGNHKFVGEFKRGMPNGKGVYTYNENEIYTGNMQDGYREGKGEMYTKKDGNEEIVKGYWCNDEYTGKRYEPYKMSTSSTASSIDVTYSKESGKKIVIEVNSTHGRIDIVDLLFRTYSLDTDVKTLSSFDTQFLKTSNYETNKFPLKLEGKLSDGSTFEIELIKNANWKIRVFVNR